MMRYCFLSYKLNTNRNSQPKCMTDTQNVTESVDGYTQRIWSFSWSSDPLENQTTIGPKVVCMCARTTNCKVSTHITFSIMLTYAKPRT